MIFFVCDKMMANANHQIINISRNFSNFRESKLYPFIIIPSSSSSILLLQQRIRNRKHIHGLSCVSEKSGSTLVQQRPPSKDEVVEMMIDQTVEEGSTNLNGMEESEEVEYLVREYGWKVRRMVEDMNEMRMVADIQAYSFHVPSLVFDHWFFQFFKAEVLAGLLYRLRNSPPDRYACLVAEPAKEDNKVIGSTKSQAHQNHQQLVGVVDVTVFRDADVLPHLLGAEEYLYISGIAVSNNFRRQKVATVLLKACEVIAVLWGYEYLVLRAYEDDWGARSLYTNAGFQIVSRDPIWVTLIGRKRRILMTKRLPYVS